MRAKVIYCGLGNNIKKRHKNFLRRFYNIQNYFFIILKN